MTACDRNGGVQLVGLTGQRPQLLGCLGRVARLAEKTMPQRQRLVRADHKPIGSLTRDRKRLLPCQQARDLTRRRKAGPLLNAAFVEHGRNRFESNPRIGQQQLPCAALRSQD